jgi:hypothetical protein
MNGAYKGTMYKKNLKKNLYQNVHNFACSFVREQGVENIWTQGGGSEKMEKTA